MQIETKKELLHAGIDAKTSDWPDVVKQEDPGPEEDARSRAIWYREHKSIAEGLQEDGEDSDIVEEFLEERNESRT